MHRAVRHGAILWIVAVLEFVGGMIVAQLAWTNPRYSLTQNVISDLGAIHCQMVGSRHVCSPLHSVFNGSLIVAGIVLILGLLLLRSALPRKRPATVGIGLLVVSSLGAIGVGLFPEDYLLPAHLLSAFLAFAGGNLAVLFIGLAMRSDRHWGRGWSVYSVGSGLVGLAALGLIVVRAYDWGGFFSAWGEGGIERTIAAPIFLWVFVAGLRLARLPTYAPHELPQPTAR